ncbi:erythromycin esterase family protein [Streptomyces sp. NPDC006872]|uniref:erythromycin esterase family protein n=1 Tax=Streptomyces sp. NPDC006872 TaxID=3155720 RepID=UPI003411BAE1
MIVGGPAAAASHDGDEPIVAAVQRAARPLHSTEPRDGLEDLGPVGAMVGRARVVGLGEATHGSHEFVTMKHRVFRYLVEKKGFRTVALEAPWSTGRRLDAYLVHGHGDPRRIMSEDLQYAYELWNSAEYLDLVEWMRAYNLRHPGDPVRIMGDDFGYTGPELYDRVIGYVAAAHPELRERIAELYRGLPPTLPSGAYQKAYFARPLTERQEMADRTGQAVALLAGLAPPAAAGPQAREEHAWALRDATAIDQTAHQYAFDPADPEQVAAIMRWRDSAMADNVVWWQERTGTRVLLSAHNGHVAYESEDPLKQPKTQGAFLRDRLGTGYTAIGFTFGQGSFKATDPAETMMLTQTVGPPAPGGNEYVLDRVRHLRYVLDLRTAPAVVRDWLTTARPTRSIGTAYPEPEYDIALARSYDILIHLHRVQAVRLLNEP